MVNSREMEENADHHQANARNLLKEKKYFESIEEYKLALKISQDLGWEGQVGMIQKEIERIENFIKIMGYDSPGDSKSSKQEPGESALLKKLKNEEVYINKISLAKSKAFEKKYDEAIALYNEAVVFYDENKLPFKVKELKWQIMKWEKQKEQDERPLSDYGFGIPTAQNEPAQSNIKKNPNWDSMREEQLRPNVKDIVRNIEQPSVSSQSSSWKDSVEDAKRSRLAVFEAKKAGVEVDQYEQERKKREEKEKLVREREEKEKEVLTEIEFELEKAKSLVDSHKYSEAKRFYSKVKELFLSIGWNHQAETIDNEVMNLDKMEKDHEEKLRIQREQAEKEKESYKKREDELRRAEQKRLEELERKKHELTPEQKQKAETIDMLMEKAKQNEEKEKYEQAVNRYEYVLELLKELPPTIMDPTGIRNKIAELKKKIPNE